MRSDLVNNLSLIRLYPANQCDTSGLGGYAKTTELYYGLNRICVLVSSFAKGPTLSFLHQRTSTTSLLLSKSCKDIIYNILIAVGKMFKSTCSSSCKLCINNSSPLLRNINLDLYYPDGHISWYKM